MQSNDQKKADQINMQNQMLRQNFDSEYSLDVQFLFFTLYSTQRKSKSTEISAIISAILPKYNKNVK